MVSGFLGDILGKGSTFQMHCYYVSTCKKTTTWKTKSTRLVAGFRGFEVGNGP